jgi:hypothetical protein
VRLSESLIARVGFGGLPGTDCLTDKFFDSGSGPSSMALQNSETVRRMFRCDRRKHQNSRVLRAEPTEGTDMHSNFGIADFVNPWLSPRLYEAIGPGFSTTLYSF